MKTISRLGDTPLAGSEQAPTTYKIKSCPGCYAYLPWRKKSQTVVTCDNCGQVVHANDITVVQYVRQHVRAQPHTLTSLLLVFWMVAQLIDHEFRLRKLLLYAIMRMMSWIP